MFVERKRLTVPAMPLTASGTVNGIITVGSIQGLYVGQEVVLKGTSLPLLLVKIKRFISDTQFYVGDIKKPIGDRINVSAYTLAASSTIEAAEQERPGITTVEHERAVYAEEPIVAKRSILVDPIGRYYDTLNPMPVALTNSNIELRVQLTHLDNFPNPGDIADSVRIGNGTSLLGINTDGSINNIQQNRIITSKHDEINIIRDVFNKISVAEFKLANVTQQTLTLTRNVFGSVTNVKRT